MFVAMLPANIYAAQHALSIGREPATPLWLRLPEQVVYIAVALAPVFARWQLRKAPRTRTQLSGRAHPQPLS